MRTLEEIDAEIMVLIREVAKLAAEREQIRPNPMRIKIMDNVEGISVG